MNTKESKNKKENEIKKGKEGLENLSRRNFLKKMAVILAGVSVLGVTTRKLLKNKNETGDDNEKKYNNERKEISWQEYKKIKPKLEFHFKEIYKDLNIEGLQMLGTVGKYGTDTTEGKVLRTLRFKNVANAVEYKYNLPKNLILAMVMQETTGADLLPNAKDDGGFGLCHMQGSIAKEFNLKTFDNCKELKCNKGHAKKLREIIEKNKYNRKLIYDKDDRLHPIFNLDAVGRMLSSYMSGKRLKGKLSNLDPLQTALARYAGAVNYKKYSQNIFINMKLFKSKEEIQKIKDIFNKQNPNLKINGEKADFDTYVEESMKQNLNYGLESYKEGQIYLPKFSNQILKKYKDYIED